MNWAKDIEPKQEEESKQWPLIPVLIVMLIAFTLGNVLGMVFPLDEIWK